ncbi:MAG TPA: class I SAM-dependent methyltransferase [Dermatophilaceae bacterium]|uniref:Methyltransferase domain-containing protein n=2 Tax=Candidatus Phosphoribacter hodrii TaxID=2953743 RepID=A0A934X7L8_9MICO|nr:methyltransferase domain-containing protein [Candidatus Phosphoribacter hodrii]MBP8838704.1 methyltransferase domain-containing protein [Dermatophilaceae bacterium]HOA58889.1 class I SAM-dependent methyltransferase [Dermatophilaceae bacterium]HPZ69539.1 class I SAM-dependent methyltransferase [Dermatophilaceae bacterium]
MSAMDPLALRRDADTAETAAANRTWWDAEASDYYTEHGSFLGDDDLVWGPEGWSEELLGLLGDVAGRDVLEIGGGAAQGGRWARQAGARVVSSDLSLGMLARGRAIDAAHDWAPLPLVQCDGLALPFAEASFDVVFTAYGVLPFVADSGRVLREVCRVLRPGGRFVFSCTHPFRWAFPDEPDEAGLTVRFSYFDRTPYVEQDAQGRATYAEHHRTIGDRVRDVVAAGLRVVDLVELEWPDGHEQEWGGWSPLRGRLIPGTLVMVADKPS